MMIINCVVCGELFTPEMEHVKVCPKCQEIIVKRNEKMGFLIDEYLEKRKNKRFGFKAYYCEDCREPVVKSSMARNVTRCDKCQDIHKKELNKIRQKRWYEKHFKTS